MCYRVVSRITAHFKRRSRERSRPSRTVEGYHFSQFICGFHSDTAAGTTAATCFFQKYYSSYQRRLGLIRFIVKSSRVVCSIFARAIAGFRAGSSNSSTNSSIFQCTMYSVNYASTVTSAELEYNSASTPTTSAVIHNSFDGY